MKQNKSYLQLIFQYCEYEFPMLESSWRRHDEDTNRKFRSDRRFTTGS